MKVSVIYLYALPRPRLAEFPVIDAYARHLQNPTS